MARRGVDCNQGGLRRSCHVHHAALGDGWADGELPGRVFLAYASRHGHALIDRVLYLPQSR